MEDSAYSSLPPLPDIPLHNVDIRAELARRPVRNPDFEAENRALIELAEELSLRPHNVLQKLTEVALRLCRAGSAGVSLLERYQGSLVFRWVALAGAYEVHREGTMLRDASPCGVTVDCNATQLMYLPEQIFPMRATPRIYEALLIPFHLDRKPIGTVWVVTHDSARQFDREDERVLSALTKFASVGWMLHETHIEAEQLARKHWDQLVATNEMLQTMTTSLSNTLMKSGR